jgi:hypothetical protein
MNSFSTMAPMNSAGSSSPPTAIVIWRAPAQRHGTGDDGDDEEELREEHS